MLVIVRRKVNGRLGRKSREFSLCSSAYPSSVARLAPPLLRKTHEEQKYWLILLLQAERSMRGLLSSPHRSFLQRTLRELIGSRGELNGASTRRLRSQG